MSSLDHLIVAGPDLGAMTAWLHSATGLTATPGGRHPGQGTHNALVGLGPDTYLELMAPDPSGEVTGTYRRSVAHLEAPELFTWCARTSNSVELVAKAEALGLSTHLLAGSRRTLTGAELRWRLVIVEDHGLGGHVPFFIDWLDTPHPAGSIERQATLVELRLDHPDAVGLTNLLGALGIEPTAAPLVVARSDTAAMTARLATPGGIRELTGTGGSLSVA